MIFEVSVIFYLSIYSPKTFFFRMLGNLNFSTQWLFWNRWREKLKKLTLAFLIQNIKKNSKWGAKKPIAIGKCVETVSKTLMTKTSHVLFISIFKWRQQQKCLKFEIITNSFYVLNLERTAYTNEQTSQIRTRQIFCLFLIWSISSFIIFFTANFCNQASTNTFLYLQKTQHKNCTSTALQMVLNHQLLS